MSTELRYCSHCGQEKPLDQFNRRYCGGNKDDTGMGYDHRCKSCQSLYSKSLREAKRNAPPKPDRCDCCGKVTESLVIDHIRGTSTVRGWICKQCNQGIGLLGDTLAGITNAFKYLNHPL